MIHHLTDFTLLDRDNQSRVAAEALAGTTIGALAGGGLAAYASRKKKLASRLLSILGGTVGGGLTGGLIGGGIGLHGVHKNADRYAKERAAQLIKDGEILHNDMKNLNPIKDALLNGSKGSMEIAAKGAKGTKAYADLIENRLHYNHLERTPELSRLKDLYDPDYQIYKELQRNSAEDPLAAELLKLFQ